LGARHNYNLELAEVALNEKINKFESMLINENDTNKKATINQVIFSL